MIPEKTSKSYVSYLLYLAAAFTAFFPSLVLNQAYFANDLLQFNHSARAFLKNALLAGHFPLWNPYLLGGQPFFADPNSSMCYPLNYLTTLLFPVAYGLGVYFFLHMFIAACGMHLWLKSLRMSESACRVGALLFSLSGFFWWEVIHPQNLAAFSWFPWFLAALEHLSRDFAPRRAFTAGLSLALIGLCESFQMTSYFFYAGLFYFLLRILVPGDNSTPSADRFSLKRWGAVLLFGLWGSLVILVHVIPAYEFSNHSNRTSPNQTYDNFNGQFSMRPSSTYEFLFPTLGLAPGETIESGVQQITDQTNTDNAYLGIFGYMGIWIPFLVYLAFRRKEKKFLYFILALAVLCLLFAWGRYAFLQRILCVVLPGIKLSRVPFRILACYVGFTGLLASYGYQELEKTGQGEKKNSGLVLGGVIYAVIFSVVALFKPQESWRELLALVLGAGGLLLWGMTQSWKQLGRYLFLTALIAPLFLTGWSGFGWGPASNYDFERNFPVLTSLRSRGSEGRFYFNPGTLPYPVEQQGRQYQTNLPENSAEEFGIRSVGGYNPLQLQDVMDFKAGLSKNLPNYEQMTAILGLLLGSNAGEIKGFKHLVANGIHYYESVVPPRFVTAPARWKWVQDPKERLLAMQNADFNPQDQVLLSYDLPPSIQSQLTGQKVAVQYDQVKDEPDTESFKVRLDKNSLVVFSEINFLGWKASVDGKPTELLTGNHVFRTIFVPAGEHLVEFQFEPIWAKPLLIGTFLWLASALGLFLFGRRKKSHPPSAHA